MSISVNIGQIEARMRVFAFPFIKAGLNTRWNQQAGAGGKCPMLGAGMFCFRAQIF
jgi:hypothetical protein